MLKDAILHATLPVKLVIFLLFASSVSVWALIIYNLLRFKKMEEKDSQFIDFFWGGGIKNLLGFYARYDEFYPSPIARMCAEIGAALSNRKITPERITRVIEQEVRNTVEDISRFQFIFATIASSAPFIGLFGTVWGIMHSFHQIAKMGRAGLEVVAPGISEALFTTAMGLFAAIPAVIAYNFFQNKIRKMKNKIESFTTELENILIKETTKKEKKKTVEKGKGIDERGGGREEEEKEKLGGNERIEEGIQADFFGRSMRTIRRRE